MATKKKRVAKTKKKNPKKATKSKSRAPPTLSEVLGGKAPTSFEARKLSSMATWRWRNDQPYEAFLLFDAAMHRALGSDARSQASAAANRNRAAVTLHESKRDPDEARRRLRAVVDDYAARPDFIEDRHFVDWALTCLIEDAAEREPNAAAFTRAYRACVAEGQVLMANQWSSGSTFPVIHVDRLIKVAKRAGAADVVAELKALG